MATVQQLEAALLKAHNAGDTRGAQAIANEIKRVNAEPPNSAAAFGKGILEGATNVLFKPFEWGYQAASALGVPGTKEVLARNEADKASVDQAMQQYKQAHPNWFAGGKLVGETVATLPVGAGLGGVVRTATTGTRLAQAGEAVATGLGSGGFKTGLVPTRAAIKLGEDVAPTIAQRVADLGVRASTGAVTGATTAKLTGQDAELGAALGGLMPTAGSMVGRVAMDKVILPAYERLMGQVGPQRAAAIFRSAFNMTIQQAKDLAAKMPEGMTFGEGLVRAGKNEPTVQALQQTAAEGAGKHIYEPMAQAQTAHEQSLLNAARGGDTAAEAEHNLLQRQTQASAEYAPAYEAARQRANVGAEVIPPLRAQGQAATQTAEEAAGVQKQLADLRAQGIDVLESSPIAAKIRQKAMAEGITPTQREALLATADDITALGPIARAGDLDAIYREGGLKAQKLIQSLNPTGMAKQTSKLLGDIQPDIAEAIESAGGTGYSAAKTQYGAAMAENNRQKFAGDLSDIYGKNPPAFADIMGGTTKAATDTVRQAFPTGGKLNFDVNAMLGPVGSGAGPSRLPSLQLVAENIGVRNKMAEQANAGSELASSLMQNPPVEKDIFALGNLVKTPAKLGMTATNPLGGLAMHIVDLIHSGRVDAATGQALAEGLQSGKSAEELLSLIPLADRAQLLRRAAPDMQNRAKSIFGVNAFNALNTPPPQDQNVMTGY